MRTKIPHPRFLKESRRVANSAAVFSDTGEE
jgi:hypothetical protein